MSGVERNKHNSPESKGKQRATETKVVTGSDLSRDTLEKEISIPEAGPESYGRGRRSVVTVVYLAGGNPI